MLGAKGLWITTIILQIHIGRVAFCCDMLLLPAPPRHSSKMPTINNTCLLNMPSVEQGPQSVYVPLLIPYLLHTVYSSCWMSWRTAICCCARNVNIDGHSRHSKVSWHVLSPHSLTHSLTHLTSIHIPYAWIQCLGHLQQGVQKMRVKHPTMAPLLPAKYVIEYEPPWKSVYVYTHHTA